MEEKNIRLDADDSLRNQQNHYREKAGRTARYHSFIFRTALAKRTNRRNVQPSMSVKKAAHAD